MDTLEQQLTKETILESNCQNAFRVLKTQFEKIFTSILIKPSSLDEVKASDAISKDKAQERCMVSYQKLHSHIKLLSNNDLKGTRTEYGFKLAFATLFGQDLETFTGTMFLNMDQLEKQLDNEEFQEIGSMASFRIPEFRDTLIQHMESVKKSIDKRAHHNREYNSRVNERHMHTTKEKVDTSKALDASLISDPYMMKSQWLRYKRLLKSISFAIEQQHAEQPEFNNKGEVDQNAEQCHDTFDVNNDLSKPVTTHYLTKERESAVVKPHHVIASSESRNSSKNMPRFSLNGMVHNYYLDEAKKKTQERGRNSRPNAMPSARSQSTINDCKPEPRMNTKTLRIGCI
ncbi:hypothetical protein Tco_0689229 [Tanacetum coccineum]